MHINHHHHLTVAVSLRNLRNTSYTLKRVPLHCNLLLVLQSQVTNAMINSFLNF